jgi:methyl-accepting chemotaxis protein
MLNHAPIPRKLTILCLVFAIPIIFLAALLVIQFQKDFKFTDQEIIGNRYIVEIRGGLDRVFALQYTAKADADAAAAELKAWHERFETLRKEFDGPLNSAAASSAASSNVSDYSESARATAFGAARPIISSLVDLVTRVADQSNLILDPELGSYYVMISLVESVPVLLSTLNLASDLTINRPDALSWEAEDVIEVKQLVKDSANLVKKLGTALKTSYENDPSGAVAAVMTAPLQALASAFEAYTDEMEMVLAAQRRVESRDRTLLRQRWTALDDSIFAFWSRLGEAMDTLLARRSTQMHFDFFVNLAIVGAALIVALLLAWRIGSSIGRPMTQLKAIMTDLAEGDITVQIPYQDRRDEIGGMAQSLAVFKDTTVASIRLRAALEAVSTPVIVTDETRTAVAANAAAREHFDAHAEAIAAEIPGFSTESLVGSPVDVLYQGAPAVQARLDALDAPLTDTVILGRRTHDVTISPVESDRGIRLGTVMEWRDRTDRLAVESEVRTLVDASVAGDFSKRADVSSKTGFMRELSERMNELVSTVDDSLHQLVAISAALAEGSLSRRIEQEYQGSFELLRNAMNGMADRLTDTIRGIHVTGQAVHIAAGEISRGSEDLASRTEQQAASLQETAAAMEELTVTVRQNSDNAKRAKQLADDARGAAEKGGQLVDPAVQAMGQIEQSSEKISDIISVIEEIAFQTNLLALNAAVEAARAGDAGRGFAVVASEVRALAQRTSGASKEIKELITRSNHQVKNGASLVNDAGRSLQDILMAVRKVVDTVGEISASSQEQAAGLEEINAAVAQMDGMTQQNAALVEESATAAQSMAHQAQELVRIVSFFKLEEGDLDETPHAPASAPVARLEPRRRAANSVAEALPTRAAGRGRQATRKKGDATLAEDQDWSSF